MPNTDIGLLGIELATRRRNRLTGRITEVGDGGISIAVVQSFGNCPRYIQTREVAPRRVSSSGPAALPIVSDRMNTRARALISKSDTFFIATAYSDGTDAASNGADVSHRGGKPGFVRVEDEKRFAFPDFSGNKHFNTIGNILLNPRAGFLFIDFDTGDLAYLTGEAEVAWDGAEVDAFAKAERLVRARIDRMIYLERALPLRFDFGEYSRALKLTGDW